MEEASQRLRQSRTTLERSSKQLEVSAFLMIVLAATAAALPRLPPEGSSEP
jgi:hypothetical protein